MGMEVVGLGFWGSSLKGSKQTQRASVFLTFAFLFPVAWDTVGWSGAAS